MIATSTLNFYKSVILTPGKNAMYSATAATSNFTSYLATCWKEKIEKFQYIKHGLNISIKLNKNQGYVNLIDEELGDYPYNYVSIQNSDDARTFYYFITNINWRAESTIIMTLALDTVATFWDQLEFTDKTTLIREHKDRFVVPANDIVDYSSLVRKIDQTDEGFTVTNLIKDNVTTIKDAALPDSTTRAGLENLWYLVYRSEFAGASADQNPVNCYLCADEDLKIKSASGPVVWDTADLDDNKIYFAIVRDNPNGIFEVVNGSSTTRTYQLGGAHSSSTTYKVFKLYWDSVSEYWVARALYYNNGGGQTYSGYEGLNDIVSVTFDNGAEIVWVATATSEIIDATDYTWLDRYYASSSFATETETGNTFDAYLLGVDNSFDRTDSRILKIIEMPYCPTNQITYNSGTQTWNYDASYWTFADGKLKLQDLGASFQRQLGTFDIPDMTLFVADVDAIKASAPRNDALESKIFHSNISPLKLTYDSFSIDYARERYTQVSSSSNVKYGIYFKQTNTINSKLGFKITDTYTGNYTQNQDFENFLLASRNNESMIYNSEYLNYIRNGYNYDKKANALSVTQSIVNSVIGASISGLRVGLSHQGEWSDWGMYEKSLIKSGEEKSLSINDLKEVPQFFRSSSQLAGNLALGAASSAVQSIVNTVFTIAQNENAMQSKLQTLRAQSISTAGADDLDLMKWYCDNTLKQITYKPIDSIKEALLDMFYYAGYNCNNVKAIPNLYSRKNWNFVQCSPVFAPMNEANLTAHKEYLDDIKQRFEIGLTVFHNITDFDQTTNNLENSLDAMIPA